MQLEDKLNLDRQVEIVDIGASPVDGPPPYLALLETGCAHVTGFEPSKNAMNALKDSKYETYLPYAIGDGDSHTLYYCQASGMNSLLEPDSKQLAFFPTFEKHGRVRASAPIETRCLDDLNLRCDFLKIDAQGSELTILKNAEKTLKNTVAIQLEVSFIPLYKRQPVFGEIDIFLRSHGFIPHVFIDIKTWTVRVASEQILEADMLYVKDYSKPLPKEQFKYMAMIAHYCYGLQDLTAYCLQELNYVST